MKKQNGITLIALVITSIVLLILAGVSIAMLTGDNGILTKATTAGEETNKQEVLEAVKLGISEIQADKLDTVTPTSEKKTDGKLSPNSIVEAAISNNPSVEKRAGETYATTEITSETTIKLTFKNVNYVVTYTPASSTEEATIPATITIDVDA